MFQATRTATALALISVLAACGGGGGGGGGASATLSSFTRFSAITPGAATRIQGSSQEANFTWNSGSETVTSISAVTPFTSGAKVDLMVDNNGNPTMLNFTSTNGSNVSFSTANGDTIGPLISNGAIGGAATKALDKGALFALSQTIGWDYQTFGIWFADTSGTGGTAGSFSVGAQTPGSAIPTTGTGSYTGAAGGLYVDASGKQYFTIASMTAGANFSTRSIAFSTSGTQQTQDLSTFTTNTNLDLAGTLTYAAGVNKFTGSISSVGGGPGNTPMNGSATGSFYGPAAEEIGGGFVVRGSGTTGYLGAFGGKK